MVVGMGGEKGDGETGDREIEECDCRLIIVERE